MHTFINWLSSILFYYEPILRNLKEKSIMTTVNSLFVATASITIVCSRIDDDDGKVGVWL